MRYVLALSALAIGLALQIGLVSAAPEARPHDRQCVAAAPVDPVLARRHCRGQTGMPVIAGDCAVKLNLACEQVFQLAPGAAAPLDPRQRIGEAASTVAIDPPPPKLPQGFS